MATISELAKGYAAEIQAAKLAVTKSASREPLRKAVESVLGNAKGYVDEEAILKQVDQELGLSPERGFVMVFKGSLRDSLRRERYIQDLLDSLK